MAGSPSFRQRKAEQQYEFSCIGIFVELMSWSTAINGPGGSRPKVWVTRRAVLSSARCVYINGMNLKRLSCAALCNPPSYM